MTKKKCPLPGSGEIDSSCFCDLQGRTHAIDEPPTNTMSMYGSTPLLHKGIRVSIQWQASVNMNIYVGKSLSLDIIRVAVYKDARN